MQPTPTLEILTVIPSVNMIPVWFAEVAKWILLTLSVITAIIGFLKIIAKPLKSIGQKIDTVDQKVSAVDEKVGAVQDDVADIQGHLLNQAHDYYLEKGWCPPDIKEGLSVMCDQYTEKGHNHIRPRYRDTLINLPETPPAARVRSKPRARQPQQQAGSA